MQNLGSSNEPSSEPHWSWAAACRDMNHTSPHLRNRLCCYSVCGSDSNPWCGFDWLRSIMHRTHKAAGLRVSPHRNPSAKVEQFSVQGSDRTASGTRRVNGEGCMLVILQIRGIFSHLSGPQSGTKARILPLSNILLVKTRYEFYILNRST